MAKEISQREYENQEAWLSDFARERREVLQAIRILEDHDMLEEAEELRRRSGVAEPVNAFEAVLRTPGVST